MEQVGTALRSRPLGWDWLGSCARFGGRLGEASLPFVILSPPAAVRSSLELTWNMASVASRHAFCFRPDRAHVPVSAFPKSHRTGRQRAAKPFDVVRDSRGAGGGPVLDFQPDGRGGDSSCDRSERAGHQSAQHRRIPADDSESGAQLRRVSSARLGVGLSRGHRRGGAHRVGGRGLAPDRDGGAASLALGDRGLWRNSFPLRSRRGLRALCAPRGSDLPCGGAASVGGARGGICRRGRRI